MQHATFRALTRAALAAVLLFGSGLAAAQSPQGIRRGLLRTALESPEAKDGTWTDEAALLEA